MHAAASHLMQGLQTPELDLLVSCGGKALHAQLPAVLGLLEAGQVGRSPLLRARRDGVSVWRPARRAWGRWAEQRGTYLELRFHLASITKADQDGLLEVVHADALASYNHVVRPVTEAVRRVYTRCDELR